MARKNAIDLIAFVLVAIGALNWGIVGAASLLGSGPVNIVATLFGAFPTFLNMIYTLVGLSGAYMLWSYFSK